MNNIKNVEQYLESYYESHYGFIKGTYCNKIYRYLLPFYNGYHIENSFYRLDVTNLFNLEKTERMKLNKISYLFDLPIHVEIINNFLFSFEGYQFLYVSLTGVRLFDVDVEEFSSLLSKYKGILFNFNYTVSVDVDTTDEPWDLDLDDFNNKIYVLETLLCLSSNVDIDCLIEEIKKDLQKSFNLCRGDGKEMSTKLLLKEEEISKFFTREFLFEKYSLEKYFHKYVFSHLSSNSFFVYEFKEDLLCYYLLGAKVNSLNDVTTYGVNAYEKYNYLDESEIDTVYDIEEDFSNFLIEIRNSMSYELLYYFNKISQYIIYIPDNLKVKKILKNNGSFNL